ncbi:MAG TPA: pre-peptidase C-terminal domain-containing protein [Kofleriaceae bacterium]|nr:pre-peptidase C-terminal domain-containing protein [Kofleriaceae bacterium]
MRSISSGILLFTLITSGCAVEDAGAPPTLVAEEPTDKNPGDVPGDGVGGAPRPVYHKDGTVEVGTMRFDVVEDFQASPEFRDVGRRCASEDERTTAMIDPSDCSMSFTKIQPEYVPGSVLTIPVVFHVIQKTDGTGAISEDLLRSQIDILNEDFLALSGTPGAGGRPGAIRFALATVDPDGNPTEGIEVVTNDSWFRDPGPGAPSPMKNALAWDPERYFNLYTNDASGALGYATFPSQNAGSTSDGVVLLWTSVGRDAPQGGIYNQGRTATHEVGHYLGLFHTFQGGCGSSSSPYSSGDLVADTVAHSQPDFDCVAAASSCGGGQLPIKNFMDYTPDTCMTGFSTEQVNRMRCSMMQYRSELYSIDGGQSTPPEAEFSASPAGLEVSFHDDSTDAGGSVVGWSWKFGDGATSTTRHPSHTYAAAGTYTVTLTVTDDDGATGSVSHAVTVSTGGGGSALESGVPRTGLAGATGAELHFTIDVPAGATSLTVSTSGGTGDGDLYVRRAGPPTVDAWDQRPYKSGNAETVSISSPAAGRYYVMVRGYQAFSGLTLEAVVDDETREAVTSSAADLSAAAGQALHYSIEIPAGARNLTITTSGGSGDADLYVRRGAQPTTDAWDFRPYEDGNDEAVQVVAPDSGRWYLMVRAYQAFSGVTLTVSYDPPG